MLAASAVEYARWGDLRAFLRSTGALQEMSIPMKNQATHKCILTTLLLITTGFWPLSSVAAPGSDSKSETGHAKSAPEPKLGPAPDAKTEAKVNFYITIMNAESAPIFEDRAHWISELRDPKAGPTCKEQNLQISRGVGHDAEATYAEYKKKILAKPKLETDAAALKMVEALQDLRKPTEEGIPYYSAKDQDKHCARVKALHPVLMAGWDKYIEGYEELRPFIDKFTDERDWRQVATTAKKYGKHYRYHLARIVNASKSLLRAAEAQFRNPRDTAVIVNRLNNLSALVDDTKDLIQKDNAAKRDDTYPPSLSLMISDSMPSFQRSVKRFVGAIDDKSARNRANEIKSDWEQVVKSYNGVVDEMNGIGFERSQK